MLSVQVPYLEPDHHRLIRRAGRAPRDFQQPSAEEEHHRRVSRGAKLLIYGQAEHVTIEVPAAAQVYGAQQNPAAQYVHATILPAEAATAPVPGSPATDWSAGQIRHS